MRSMIRHPLTATLAVGLGACSLIVGSPDDYTYGDPDAGFDGGLDAGPPDAGLDEDAGPADAGVDAGLPDAAPPARCTDLAHECDLTISCGMPATVPGSGSSLRVPFMVSNLGTLSGAGPFRIAVRMDHGGTFEEVGSETFSGILMPISTQSGEVAFVVPAWVVPGENILLCIVDADDDVPETAEANNEDASSFVAAGLPDLQLPFVSIAASPTEPFPTTFDIENDGPTSALMVDWMISGSDASGGDTLATEVVPVIEAGQTLRITRTVSKVTPGGYSLSGPGDVLYRLDRFGVISESDESNNDFRRSVTW